MEPCSQTRFRRGALVAVLIVLAFFLDRRIRLFTVFGTAIVGITGAAVPVNVGVIPPSIPVGDQETINHLRLRRGLRRPPGDSAAHVLQPYCNPADTHQYAADQPKLGLL
jgi:hypothetical protein